MSAVLIYLGIAGLTAAVSIAHRSEKPTLPALLVGVWFGLWWPLWLFIMVGVWSIIALACATGAGVWVLLKAEEAGHWARRHTSSYLVIPRFLRKRQ